MTFGLLRSRSSGTLPHEHLTVVDRGLMTFGLLRSHPSGMLPYEHFAVVGGGIGMRQLIPLLPYFRSSWHRRPRKNIYIWRS